MTLPTHPFGHNPPVEVTFQFLQVPCPVMEVSDRYSAVKLAPSLPRPGPEKLVAHATEGKCPLLQQLADLIK